MLGWRDWTIILLVLYIIMFWLDTTIGFDSLYSESGKRRIDYFESYLYSPEFKIIGSVRVNENMTWREIRSVYSEYRQYPGANAFLTSHFEEFCELGG